jgi:hypothetical protein
MHSNSDPAKNVGFFYFKNSTINNQKNTKMKFNILKKIKGKTSNYEGAEAFVLTPELELYTAVVTASLSDKFYEKTDERLTRIQTLLQTCDPGFVAKLAVYAREKMYLRSIPLVLAVELAKTNSGNSIVSKLVERIVQRADEITELLAYYQFANNRSGPKKLNKLSKQVQKGLSAAFNKFDEYQFAKYDRATEVSLKDALFLVHPKAKDNLQQELFDKIVQGSMKVPYTWETELSALGQGKFESEAAKAAAFKATWEALVESKKVGYMALLRNLRNLLEAKVSYAHLTQVSAYLADAKAVEHSKQMPFRFLAAYRELKKVNSGYTSLLLTALEEATRMSAVNVKGFDYNTSVVIACDVSGSMQKRISDKSSVMNFDIGLVLAMMLQSKCRNVLTGMFGDTWKMIPVSSNNILANVDEFYKREGEVGYSTNGYKVLEDLISRKVIVDKVMFFTDCQLWDSSGNQTSVSALWRRYKELAPKAKIYLFDLAGYGKSPLKVIGNDVFLIAGWSDKIFDMLAAIENGSNAIAEIEKIEI